MDNTWIKVDIFTTSEGVESLCSALSELGYDSFSVVDSADLKNLMEGKYGAWDYIDPELMKLSDVETAITLYVQNQSQPKEGITAIKQMLERIKATDPFGKFGRLECEISQVKEENWADSWKEGYDPTIIGEKLAVCPSWMECKLDKRLDGRKIISIDPGMAFGTGLDVTTRLCLEAMESIDAKTRSILDIGCGSGILAIGALLLGAQSALGVDIDEVAVKTAKENAELNGVSNQSEFICGNPADIVKSTYDIVCANISADVILLLMPEFPKFLNHGGTLILSGIIKDREQEITSTLQNIGLSIIDFKDEKGWVCIVATMHL